MSVLAVNKKARFDYELLETFQAGLVLTGPEVKSAKLGQVSLKSSFVTLKGGILKPQFYLTNAVISPYKCANQEKYDNKRSRQLLLNKKEIAHLVGKAQEKGLTLVATKLYTVKDYIKLEFAVARGKKKYDKREDIKRKDLDRQMKRTLTNK
ncbi:MAG: SsrA-binding protein SmpB [Patescibacteria group bacterium]|nr:SsrA-binding protein SmpB [Patescibacteria group bacterium]